MTFSDSDIFRDHSPKKVILILILLTVISGHTSLIASLNGRYFEPFKTAIFPLGMDAVAYNHQRIITSHRRCAIVLTAGIGCELFFDIVERSMNHQLYLFLIGYIKLLTEKYGSI